jgi:hypothetical protein
MPEDQCIHRTAADVRCPNKTRHGSNYCDEHSPVLKHRNFAPLAYLNTAPGGGNITRDLAEFLGDFFKKQRDS